MFLRSFDWKTFSQPFTLRLCLSLRLKCVSCIQQKVGSCFCIHSLSLCLFIGELSPLILRDINDPCLLIPVISLVVMIVCFPFLGFADGSLSISYIFVCVVSILGLCFPSSTFCRAGFLDTYCLKLVLSWNILFSPSMVTESFAGYSSLALNSWSLMYAAHLPRTFWLHGFH